MNEIVGQHLLSLTQKGWSGQGLSLRISRLLVKKLQQKDSMLDVGPGIGSRLLKLSVPTHDDGDRSNGGTQLVRALDWATCLKKLRAKPNVPRLEFLNSK